MSTLVQVCCNCFIGGKWVKKGGSRCVQNTVSHAQSVSPALASGGVDPSALRNHHHLQLRCRQRKKGDIYLPQREPARAFAKKKKKKKIRKSVD